MFWPMYALSQCPKNAVLLPPPVESGVAKRGRRYLGQLIGLDLVRSRRNPQPRFLEGFSSDEEQTTGIPSHDNLYNMSERRSEPREIASASEKPSRGYASAHDEADEDGRPLKKPRKQRPCYSCDGQYRRGFKPAETRVCVVMKS